MTKPNLTPAVFQLDGSDACYYGLHDSEQTHSMGLSPVFAREEVARMNEEQGDTWDALRKAGIASGGPLVGFADLGWTWSVVSMGAGREFLLPPLLSREQAEQFILRLERAGLSFHFDDPADEIEGSDGERVFTGAEAAAVRVRVNELFALMGDPHGMAIVALEAAGGAAVYRLEPLTSDGADVDHDKGVEYHTRESLFEAYPEAKNGPELDFAVGETVGNYRAAPIGLFHLTRIA